MKRLVKNVGYTLIITMACLTLLMGRTSAQTATQPSGSGTVTDPYQIATLENLYWLSQNSSAWNKYYI